MQRLLKEQSIEFEYQESAGKHGWAFWSEKLPAVIDFHWRSVLQQERSAIGKPK